MDAIDNLPSSCRKVWYHWCGVGISYLDSVIWIITLEMYAGLINSHAVHCHQEHWNVTNAQMIVCQKNPENVLDFLWCGVRDLARDLQRLQRQTASAGFTEYISSGEIQVQKRMPRGVPKRWQCEILFSKEKSLSMKTYLVNSYLWTIYFS